MVKIIWLINMSAMPPHLEPRLQTIKLAQYLVQQGYDVKIFASSVMQYIADHELSLPIGPCISEENVNYIISFINRFR